MFDLFKELSKPDPENERRRLEYKSVWHEIMKEMNCFIIMQ